MISQEQELNYEALKKRIPLLEDEEELNKIMGEIMCEVVSVETDLELRMSQLTEDEKELKRRQLEEKKKKLYQIHDLIARRREDVVYEKIKRMIESAKDEKELEKISRLIYSKSGILHSDTYEKLKRMVVINGEQNIRRSRIVELISDIEQWYEIDPQYSPYSEVQLVEAARYSDEYMQYMLEHDDKDVAKKVVIRSGLIDPQWFEKLMQESSEEVKHEGLRNKNLVEIALSEKITLDTLGYILKNVRMSYFYTMMYQLRRIRDLKVLNLILEREIWDRQDDDKKKEISTYTDIVNSVRATADYEKGYNTKRIISIYEKIYLYICEQYGSWWRAGIENYEIYKLGEKMIKLLPSNTNMYEEITTWNEECESRKAEKRANTPCRCSCDFSFLEEDYLSQYEEPMRGNIMSIDELFCHTILGI